MNGKVGDYSVLSFKEQNIQSLTCPDDMPSEKFGAILATNCNPGIVISFPLNLVDNSIEMYANVVLNTKEIYLNQRFQHSI